MRKTEAPKALASNNAFFHAFLRAKVAKEDAGGGVEGRTLRAVVPSRKALTTPTSRWRRRSPTLASLIHARVQRDVENICARARCQRRWTAS